MEVHERVFGYVRTRHSRLFEGNGKRRPLKPLYSGEYLNSFVDEINRLHYLVADGNLAGIKQLESMPVVEYYQAIDTFIQVQEERNKEIET